MAEVIDGTRYESLWHSSLEYRVSSNQNKERIAKAMEIKFREVYGFSAPYINKDEGLKHGFPQGYLGYPRDFLDTYLNDYLTRINMHNLVR